MTYVESALHQSLSERELVFICNILKIDHRAMNKAKMTASIDYLFSTPALNGHIPLGRVAIPYRELVAELFPSLPTHGNEMYVVKEDLLQLAKLECIDDKHFDWIDISNDRMCNFLWSTIRIATINGLKMLSVNSSDIFDPLSFVSIAAPYDRFNYLDKLPKDSNMKIKAFKHFIDILDLLPGSKINVVNRMMENWNLCTRKNDMLIWFGDITDAGCMNKCNWAWNYICKKYNTSYTSWFINNDNKKDLYNGVITTFDLLLCDANARELLKRDLKRAWSQKGYRDKNNEKKAVNVVLPENIIKMLDSICIKTDRRKNEVIARLIKEEYERILK